MVPVIPVPGRHRHLYLKVKFIFSLSLFDVIHKKLLSNLRSKLYVYSSKNMDFWILSFKSWLFDNFALTVFKTVSDCSLELMIRLLLLQSVKQSARLRPALLLTQSLVSTPCMSLFLDSFIFDPPSYLCARTAQTSYAALYKFWSQKVSKNQIVLQFSTLLNTPLLYFHMNV